QRRRLFAGGRLIARLRSGRQLRSEEQALANGGADRIFAKGLGNKEGGLNAIAAEQSFGKGGNEDRRYGRASQYVLHSVDARGSVGELDVGEDEAGIGVLDRCYSVVVRCRDAGH